MPGGTVISKGRVAVELVLVVSRPTLLHWRRRCQCLAMPSKLEEKQRKKTGPIVVRARASVPQNSACRLARWSRDAGRRAG